MNQVKEELKIIDINQRHHCQTMIYPDGQPHLTLWNIEENEEVEVVARIRNPGELYSLMGVSNALDNLHCKKKRLCVPYLMGARSDRVMKHGDSVDCEIVLRTIQDMYFENIRIFDIHNPEVLHLSNVRRNFENVHAGFLLDKYFDLFGAGAVLIVPDKGSTSQSSYRAGRISASKRVYCDKSRDENGKIILEVRDPEACKDKRCVIVDDLCDGGGTFLAIASQIQPSHLTLIVSHGIFSKGTSIFKEHFDHIITTDSYQKQIKEPLVTTLEVNL